MIDDDDGPVIFVLGECIACNPSEVDQLPPELQKLVEYLSRSRTQ